MKISAIKNGLLGGFTPHEIGFKSLIFNCFKKLDCFVVLLLAATECGERQEYRTHSVGANPTLPSKGEEVENQLKGWIASSFPSSQRRSEGDSCSSTHSVVASPTPWGEAIQFWKPGQNNKLKLSLIPLSLALLTLMMGTPLHADSDCECLSFTTSEAPNEQLRAVAKCYVDGKEQPNPESQLVNSPTDAETLKSNLMAQHHILPDACVPYPDGSMKLAPSTSTNDK